jgi:hypothetical protein
MFFSFFIRNTMKFITLARFLFPAAACWLMFCAHQVPPSGGPDDKAPPTVQYTSPRIGSVNVPVTSTVEFVFSEWINTRNADKCVSVFPPPPDGIKVSASGRKIKVRPKRAFSDSTTYHVVVSTALSDLHSNSLGNAFQFFFSTGPSIDSGKATGCVVQSDKKVLQPKVALYSRKKGDASDSVFFGLPSYLTQTDSAGNFSLENIHRGTYEIIAFSDENSNNRFEPGKETVFAPVERKFTLDRTAGPFALYQVVCDTTTRRIALLSPVSSTLLLGELTGGSTLAPSMYDSTWRVEQAEKHTMVAIKEYVAVGRSNRFILRLSDTLALEPYLLVYAKQSPLLAGSGPREKDTIRFNGTIAKDSVRPKPSVPAAALNVHLGPAIRLTWSKPVAARLAQWICTDSLKDTVKVFLSDGFSDTTIFTFKKNLRPGLKYTIAMPDSLFADCSGNMPKDSAGITLKFSTISDQDICFSVSGGASCLPADPLRKWLFLPIARQESYLSRDSAGMFRFDSIPASKGFAAFFTDFDKDGKPTTGSLVPWKTPEPYRVFPDTIEARARWDVEAVAVHGACDTCLRMTPKSVGQTETEKIK